MGFAKQRLVVLFCSLRMSIRYKLFSDLIFNVFKPEVVIFRVMTIPLKQNSTFLFYSTFGLLKRSFLFLGYRMGNRRYIYDLTSWY